MNRTLNGINLVCLVSMIAACRTTSEPVIKVDEAKNQVEFHSTGDQRTTLPDLKANKKVATVVADLRERLKKNPRDIDTLINIAQLYQLQERLDLAEGFCKQALRVDLKNRDARKILAQVYFRKGNTEMASIILNNLGGEASKDSQIQNLMALVALKEGRNAEAHALFKRAIALNPNDLAARMNLGVLYIQYRQLAEGAVQFERVLKVMPSNTDAKVHLAIIKATKGQYEPAKEIYDKVLAADKGNPIALYNLAVVESRLKNYDQAVELLKRYLQTNYAKRADNTEAFALIDDIRVKKDAGDSETSDEEIQQLAAKVKSTPGGQQASSAKEEVGPGSTPVAGDPDLDSLEKELK